jgi:hypothetical protein
MRAYRQRKGQTNVERVMAEIQRLTPEERRELKSQLELGLNG